MKKETIDLIKESLSVSLNIGTKKVRSFAMNRQDYNDLRGWKLPEDENGEDCGFLVEYMDGGQQNHHAFDGYISWSPHDVFVNSYQPATAMSFGHAIDFLKEGKKVARIGWNGKNMWVCLTKGSAIHNDDARSGAVLRVAEEGGDTIIINSHIDMRTADGSICCGWLASQADMLANDWWVVN